MVHFTETDTHGTSIAPVTISLKVPATMKVSADVCWMTANSVQTMTKAMMPPNAMMAAVRPRLSSDTKYGDVGSTRQRRSTRSDMTSTVTDITARVRAARVGGMLRAAACRRFRRLLHHAFGQGAGRVASHRSGGGPGRAPGVRWYRTCRGPPAPPAHAIHMTFKRRKSALVSQ